MVCRGKNIQARKIRGKKRFMGEKSFQMMFSNWLPDETLDKIRKVPGFNQRSAPLPVGGGITSLNVALRQMLDLYVCLYGAIFCGFPSPVKHPKKVDMVILEKILEDIYMRNRVCGWFRRQTKMLGLSSANHPKFFNKIRFWQLSSSSRMETSAGLEGSDKVEGNSIKPVWVPGTFGSCHTICHYQWTQIGDHRA